MGRGSITHDWCKYVENKALRMKSDSGAGLTGFGEDESRGKALGGYPLSAACIQLCSTGLFAHQLQAPNSPRNRPIVTKKRNKMQKPVRARVKAIPSTEPAARDEGPRLIPLRIDESEDVPMSHYLHLADKALGTVARPARIKKQDTAEQKAGASDPKKKIE